MKKTNKIISILLAVAMLLSMAPLSLTASASANDKVFIGNASIIHLKGNAATIEAGSKANFTKIKIGNEYIDFSKYKNYNGEAMFTLGDSNYEADLSGSKITGAQSNSMTGDVNITMTGGVVKYLNGSCTNSDAVLTGNVNITMTGGKVNEIWGAEYGVDGNVNITVTGGKVNGTIYIMYRDTTITGDGNVIITGGSSCTVYKEYTYGDIKGSTNLYSTLLPYGYAKDNFTNFVYIDGSNWKFGGNTATALNGNTLTIASGQTATVDSGKTLSGTIVNNGTINVKNGGTLSGTVTNNGTIFCYGNISGVTNSDSGKIIKKVTASGTNVTFNDSAWQNNKTNYDDAYNATLTAASGYALPASVTVNVGGTTLAESAYTYNASTGALSIPSAKITTDTTVSASAPINLSDSANSITLEQSEYNYTGSAITPALMVNGEMANANDYTAEYSDNTNVGTATVSVTGKNSYTGSKVLTFKILPANISEATVTLGDSLTYNGATQTQTVKSVTVNGITLTEGIDYTISGNNAKDAGTYTLTITGINNAVGTITKNWKIAPKSVTTSATVQDKIYDGTTDIDASAIEITFDGIVDGDDVVIDRCIGLFLNANAGNNKTVQIAYYISGDDVDNYEIYEDYVTVPEYEYYFIETKANILPRDIADAQIVLGDALTYNGAEQTQSIVCVTVIGKDVTYTVSGNTATNVGVYELTITGNGNFSGTKTALFEVAPDTTSIDALTVDNVKSSDKEVIEAVARQIENAVTDLASDEKKAEYKAIADKCNELLAKIDATADEIARIDEAVNSYDTETVTSADIPALGKLIDDIKALTDGQNITDDEKAALESNDEAIDELVAKLTEVAEKIKRVDEAVKSYDEATVKSTDSENLEQLKEDIQALIDSENTTENEKTVLEDMITDVEGLEDKVEEIENQLEEIKGVENDFNPENVSSDDKAVIEEKIAEIEAINPDNLTEEQKAEYDEIKADLEALLEEIEKAGSKVDAVGAELEMFDEEKVTIFSEDEIEALKAKIDELLADENMGEAEKAELEEYKAQCDNLIEIINTPAKYLSMRLFYFIWDAFNWFVNRIISIF